MKTTPGDDTRANPSGSGDAPASLTGRKFGLDGEGFLHHVASAIVQRTPVADVEPAFEDFVRVFPVKLAAGATRWTELLFAACGYFVHVARRPIGEVASALRRTIFEHG